MKHLVNTSAPQQIRNQADNVQTGLVDFEIQCTTDRKGIQREIQYLARKFTGLLLIYLSRIQLMRKF